MKAAFADSLFRKVFRSGDSCGANGRWPLGRVRSSEWGALKRRDMVGWDVEVGLCDTLRAMNVGCCVIAVRGMISHDMVLLVDRNVCRRVNKGVRMANAKGSSLASSWRWRWQRRHQGQEGGREEFDGNP